MNNDMSIGMRDKAVFVVTRAMVGSGGYFREASAMADEAERKAYRLLTLAGFTIVIFPSDASSVYADCDERNRVCDAVGHRTTPTLLSKLLIPILDATVALRIDLTRSWLVGDRLDNMEAGRFLGCHTILWLNGSETDWNMTAMRWPDFIARDIWETACLIVNAGSASVASVCDEESDQDD